VGDLTTILSWAGGELTTTHDTIPPITIIMIQCAYVHCGTWVSLSHRLKLKRTMPIPNCDPCNTPAVSSCSSVPSTSIMMLRAFYLSFSSDECRNFFFIYVPILQYKVYCGLWIRYCRFRSRVLDPRFRHPAPSTINWRVKSHKLKVIISSLSRSQCRITSIEILKRVSVQR
jgi:hypothetical protein